jgi:hypothetical protein
MVASRTLAIILMIANKTVAGGITDSEKKNGGRENF